MKQHAWEEFEWEIASHYDWRETPYGPALVVADGAASTGAYRPLATKSAALFTKFAALDPTPEAILQFARRYGSLGDPVARIWFPAEGGGEGRTHDHTVAIRSSLEHGMRVAALLPGPATHLEKLAACAGLLAPQPATVVGELLDHDPTIPNHGASWKAQIGKMASFLRWLREGALALPPRHPRALDEGFGLMHQASVNAILAETMSLRLSLVNPRTRAYQLRLGPTSLLGALWLQAALAATERMTFRECFCGHLIPIARTTGSRPDTKFCSDKCKSQDYRNRIARARVLHAKGWALGRIAKALGTSSTYVRTWIH